MKIKEESNIGIKSSVFFFKERNAKEKRKIKPNLLAEFIQEITSYFKEDPFLKMKSFGQDHFAKYAENVPNGIANIIL